MSSNAADSVNGNGPPNNGERSCGKTIPLHLTGKLGMSNMGYGIMLTMEPEAKKKWYQKTGGIIALLILFFPAGLYLMWKYTKWPKVAKWVVTGVFALFVIGGALNDSPETASNTKSAETQQVSQPTQAPQQATVEPTKDTVKATNTTAPTQTKQTGNQNTAPASNETVGQKNAVRKAKSYLAYTAFSHDGLVAQLEYEKFSHEDAVYGADNSGGNWNDQAAKKAKSYIEYSAFSRGSLIEQLKYDKFTQEQAEYGANAVGL